MTRILAVIALAGVVTIAGGLAYRESANEREYRALLEQGEQAMRGADTFRAIEAFTAAAELNPDSMLVYLRRGEAHQTRRDLDAATADFRRAATLDPGAPRPAEALGDVLYERGWFDQAAVSYEKRLSLDDAAPRVAYKLALARYRQGSVDAALEAVDDAIRLDSRFPDAHHLRALCLNEKGERDDAIAALEHAIAISPGMIAAREELADLYALVGRTSQQLEQLQVIAGLDRDNVDRQVAVGLAYARAARSARDAAVQQRHADLAVLTLGEALERAPNHPQLYGALGQVWLDIAVARNDRIALSKAVAALGRAAAEPTATSSVLGLYGLALQRDDQLEQAERVLQQATRRYPVDAGTFLTYAELAERRQHHQAARAALIEYGALTPDDPDFVGRAAAIARLSLRMNEPAIAIRWLDRGLERDPSSAELLTIAHRLGR